MSAGSIETSTLLKPYIARLSDEFIGLESKKNYLDNLVQKVCDEVFKNSTICLPGSPNKTYTKRYHIHLDRGTSKDTLIDWTYTFEVSKFWTEKGYGSRSEKEFYEFKCTCYRKMICYIIEELKKRSVEKPYNYFQYSFETNYQWNMYPKKSETSSSIIMAVTTALARFGAVLCGDRAHIIIKTQLKRNRN